MKETAHEEDFNIDIDQPNYLLRSAEESWIFLIVYLGFVELWAR